MATANLRSKITMDDADAQRKLRGFGDSSVTQARRASAAFGAVGRSLLTAFASIGAGRGIKSMMNDFDRMAKLATRFDTTAEAIQRVGFVAEQNGADVELFADALAKARRNLADSSNNAVQEAAQALGLDIDRYLKSQPLEQLAMLSDAFLNAGGGAKQSSDMFKILGRTVEEMVPTLRMGGDEVMKLGGSISTMSSGAVAEMERLNDEFDKLVTNAKVVAMKTVMGLAYGPKSFGEMVGDKIVEWMEGGDPSNRPRFETPAFDAEDTSALDAEKAELAALEDKKDIIADILTLEKERTKISAEDLDLQERATKQALDRFKGQGGLDGFAMLQTNGILGERGGMMRSRTFAPNQGVPTMPGASSGVDRQFNELVIREFRAMAATTEKTNEILEAAVGD